MAEEQELIEAKELKETELLDAARIYDRKELKWVHAWVKQFRRVKTVVALANVVFDNVTTTRTSSSIHCEPYSKFSLFVDLKVTGTPTDLLVEVFFSDDNIKFYKLMNGPFGDLRYEDSAGDLMECIQGRVDGSYMQIKATATGTTAANKFTLTCKVVFSV